MSFSSRRLTPMLVGAFGALAVILLLALSSPAAQASPFCGGYNVSTNNPCFGASRALNGANAYGDSHSVCVGVNNTAGPCSSGPGQLATINFGTTITGTPWIAINVSGSTTVQGNTF
jgi:hypothetical protein